MGSILSTDPYDSSHILQKLAGISRSSRNMLLIKKQSNVAAIDKDGQNLSAKMAA